MTLKSIKRVKAYIYKSEKWTLGESEGKRVFIIKGKAVINPYEVINCFIKVIKDKVCL
jgi:hypothetical protein